MNKSIFLILLVIGLLIPLHASVSYEDAKIIVLSQILCNEIGKADVYLTAQTLNQNIDITFGPTEIKTLYVSNWVAFIDDNPTFGWSHPCRYVVIDSLSGAYQVIPSEIYPEDLSIM